MNTQTGKFVICLIMALGLLTGSMASAATNSTSMDTGLQKEKVAEPVKAEKKKGCKCRMGMMKKKEKAQKAMMGCQGMMGGVLMKKMSEAQRKKFLDDTVSLRRQMVGKRFDFMEALRNPATTPEDLAKIEKDMLKIRIQMLDKLTGPSSE